jgi:hypothetical protein
VLRGHAGRDQRVRHLQQDGARPGQQHHALRAERCDATSRKFPTTRRSSRRHGGGRRSPALARRRSALRLTGFEPLPVRASERTVC